MLDVLVVCTALVAGLVGGWWLRGSDPRHVRPKNRSDDAARAREALERLRELTRNVAADVDKHKTMMGRITDELHASGDGNHPAVIDAVGRLIQSNERMQQQLHSAEERLEDQARQIVTHAVEARTDSLTSLANRRAFDKAIATAHEAWKNANVPTTIMMLDIDLFKNLNDTYGHQAGDGVLKGVAQRLKTHVPDEFLIARYGGEEFAVIFANRHMRDVEQLAERTRQAIAEREFEFQGLTLKVTASAGVSEFRPGESIASAIGRADEALYASKRSGRDCGHMHDGSRILAIGRGRPVADPRTGSPRATPSFDAGISSPDVFSSDLRRRLSEWRGGGAPLCVLFVQIDNLDVIREQQGDDNADAALRAMILSIKASMREMDHAARFEGDEVSLLLPGCTMRGAVAAAERLRLAASRCELPKRFDRRQFTVSIGVAEAIIDESEDELIDRVRSSLSLAALHGQDCTYVHDGLDTHLIGVGQVSMAT